jgi:catechol 2,3-dioxygenase-like lactoylglutathione lyase family enzyme
MAVRVDHHVALRVSDMDRAVRFWQEALDAELAVKPAVERSGGYFDQLYHPGVRLLIAHLRFGEGGLELFQTLDEEYPGAPNTFSHFGVTVDDAEEALRRVEAAGGSRLNDVTHMGGAAGYPKFAYCKDPDGNVLELLEADHPTVIRLMTDLYPETRA